ncbi:hypothetical protein ACOI1H_20300 [Loktanella sp. DJP18]|uniref:hypothetical protein n=1 Tax=Loktanella sp. DJP18 TaxID=3409788 RepID=UPI003BB770ED
MADHERLRSGNRLQTMAWGFTSIHTSAGMIGGALDHSFLEAEGSAARVRPSAFFRYNRFFPLPLTHCANIHIRRYERPMAHEVPHEGLIARVAQSLRIVSPRARSNNDDRNITPDVI